MTIQSISWSDGPPESAGDDNCAFIVLRAISIGAGILYVVLKLAQKVTR